MERATHDSSPTKAFSISVTMRLEYRMIGPRPDDGADAS